MRILSFLIAGLLGLVAAGMVVVAGLYLYITPQLPSIDALRDVRLQVPLRIYTADERLLGEFGEKRRIPVTIEEVPVQMVHAFLAAEDDRFFHHPGVDYQGLLRAAIELARTGEKRQGGSTITMQVARNFFLSREKTYLRKLTEILLALRIERELTKAEILELYLNKIFLGQRAYGVGAAAQVYYGSDLDGLTVAQLAMIAGLPKAPSAYNPVSNPRRALIRRNYVLARMHELGYLDDAAYAEARAEPVTARLHAATTEVEAPYVAELVRQEMVERFGSAAYTEGYRVYTTLDSTLQQAADAALRAALLAYDRRHGWRGAEGRVELSDEAGREAVIEVLRRRARVGGLQPAVVVAVAERSFTALLADGREVEVGWEGMSWAKRYKSANRRGPAPKQAADVVARGDLVRLLAPAGDDEGWRLSQVPQVEGALVSLDPRNGAVLALSGGFDFHRSKFNRVTQAVRQPGSAFKPFVYSAALENGFTPASVLNDAPVVFDDPALERAWRPENYSGRFYGPTRLREALVHSRNLVSIRLLQAIGVKTAIAYAQRFGFRPEQMPRDLSLALGSGGVTPLEITAAYAVFANGGYRVTPFYLDRIVGPDGQVLFQAEPAVVCEACDGRPAAPPLLSTGLSRQEEGADPPPGLEPVSPPAPRVISERNAWLMSSMLRDVIQRGTGRRARQLGRSDIAGKTGTTNDQRDAWFCGFHPAVVTTAWVGFDAVKPLGAGETGAKAALPAWIDYMRVALAQVPEADPAPPPGLVTVRIDPVSGELARARQRDAVFETFREEFVPRRVSHGAGGQTADGSQMTEELF